MEDGGQLHRTRFEPRKRELYSTWENIPNDYITDEGADNLI